MAQTMAKHHRHASAAFFILCGMVVFWMLLRLNTHMNTYQPSNHSKVSFSSVNAMNTWPHMNFDLFNALRNQTVSCSDYHFKYVPMFHDYFHSVYSTFGTMKWSTDAFDQVLQSQPNDTDSDGIIPINKIFRFKFKNGTMYLNTEAHYRPIYLHYRRCYIYFFYQLAQKYKHILPNFDIWLYFVDDLQWHYNLYNEFETVPPIFHSEAIDEEHLLYFVPRSLIRHYCSRVAHTNVSSLRWEDKSNVVVFRGTATNVKRDEVIYELNNNRLIKEFALEKWIDVKLNYRKHRGGKMTPKCGKWNRKRPSWNSNCWVPSIKSRMSYEKEANHKYVLIMDGFTSRDAFVRNFNYTSISLKQRSPIHEFWYLDLQNGENVLFWNDTKELIYLIKNITTTVYNHENGIKAASNALYNYGQLRNLAHNGYQYANQHFSNDALECFAVAMLRFYTTYLFNESAVEITEKDQPLTHNYVENIHTRSSKQTDYEM